jgi:hypothetical protein
MTERELVNLVGGPFDGLIVPLDPCRNVKTFWYEDEGLSDWGGYLVPKIKRATYRRVNAVDFLFSNTPTAMGAEDDDYLFPYELPPLPPPRED